MFVTPTTTSSTINSTTTSSMYSTSTTSRKRILGVESKIPKKHKPQEGEKVPGLCKNHSYSWKKLTGENFDCDYVKFFTNEEADSILAECERTLEYNTGQMAKVHIFGKWLDIPRKQVAHGDYGLSYTFSGNTIPARPWIPVLTKVRDLITTATGFDFNFVLVNRYKDGNDNIGFHKDDEKELVQNYPIASLSLGQARDFIFKHQESRGRQATKRIEPVKIELQHGSLLLMNYPTNQFWYHALPQRKKAKNVRINLTFRRMNPSLCRTRSI